MEPSLSEVLVESAMTSFARSSSDEFISQLDAELTDAVAPAERGRLLLARAIAKSSSESLADLIEATGLLELSGEYAMLTASTTYLSSLYLTVGQIDDCVNHIVRAVVLVDELSEVGIEPPPITYANLADVFRRLTAFEMALTYADYALDSYEGVVNDGPELFHSLVAAECLIEHAWHRGAGVATGAKKDLHAALAIAANIDPQGSFYAQVTSRWIMAECALLEGDFDGAQEIIGVIPTEPFDGYLEPLLGLIAAVIAQQSGRHREAIELFDSLEPSFTFDEARLHRLLRARSDSHRALGDFERAMNDAYALVDSVQDRQRRFVGALVNQVDSRSAAEQSSFALAEEADALTERTRRDDLTGVGSRSWLDTCLAQRTAGVGNLALILIDVDHFKAVNDTYSHVVGDEVLRRVGAILAESCREEDVVARFGGEEFVIIPVAGDLVGAHALGERLRKMIEFAPWDEVAPDLSVSVSVGVSAGPAKASAEVLRAADDGLYEAKAAGRNCVIAHRLGRSLLRTGEATGSRRTLGT